MGIAEHVATTTRPDVELAASVRRDVRFGAAVYGSFLAASLVGVAYQAGESARAMTVSLFGSMLVFWAAHGTGDRAARVAAGRGGRAPDRRPRLGVGRSVVARSGCEACIRSCGRPGRRLGTAGRPPLGRQLARRRAARGGRGRTRPAPAPAPARAPRPLRWPSQDGSAAEPAGSGVAAPAATLA
jgi:hypothetical protein